MPPTYSTHIAHCACAARLKRMVSSISLAGTIVSRSSCNTPCGSIPHARSGPMSRSSGVPGQNSCHGAPLLLFLRCHGRPKAPAGPLLIGVSAANGLTSPVDAPSIRNTPIPMLRRQCEGRTRIGLTAPDAPRLWLWRARRSECAIYSQISADSAGTGFEFTRAPLRERPTEDGASPA